MEIDNKAVGNRIKSIRKQKGLTTKDFGKFISGASDSLVSRWERGVNLPNNARLKMIAKFGEISVNELLYGSLEEYTHSFLRERFRNTETPKLGDQIEMQIIKEVVYQVLRNPTYNGMYAAQEFDLLNSSLQSEINRALNRFINHHGFSNDGVINYSLSGINDIKNELKLYLEKGINEELYKEIDTAFSDAYTKIHLLRNKYK